MSEDVEDSDRSESDLQEANESSCDLPKDLKESDPVEAREVNDDQKVVDNSDPQEAKEDINNLEVKVEAGHLEVAEEELDLEKVAEGVDPLDTKEDCDDSINYFIVKGTSTYLPSFLHSFVMSCKQIEDCFGASVCPCVRYDS